MTRLINYDTAFTIQNKITFDNSPGESDGVSFLDGVDFDKGVITDTGSVYRSTVNQNGHVYTMAMFYNARLGVINTLTLSVDGQTISIWDQLNLSLNTLLLYEGDVLFSIMFSGDDVIVGTEHDDVIFGYGGNDSIYGMGGDDWINGGGGIDFIHGGDGYDTAEYTFSSGKYAASKKSNGDIEIIFFSGGSERLVSIERLKFSDKFVESKDLNYVGSFTDVGVSVQTVYRFLNTRDKAFFYTADSNEKNSVILSSTPNASALADTSWPYVYQGSTFKKAHSYEGASPLYRFYNTETGHHFFTASKDEADYVRAKSDSGEWPFNYEGVAFNVYASDPNPGFEGTEVAVHRFYSSELNRHFYTASESEVAEIKLTGQWNYEGIGFWGEG